MNIFGAIQILHHEVRILTFIYSVLISLYFFVVTKESLLVRGLTAGIGMFVANLMFEIPWIFGYYLFKGGFVLALDVVNFTLGEVLIIWVFDYLRGKGLKVPKINLIRWFIIFVPVCLLVGLLVKDGFYPLWIGYEKGSVLVDPHTVYPFNLQWSISKAIAMFGWMWITWEKKK